MALPPTFSSRTRLQVGRVPDRRASPSVIGQAASIIGRTMGQMAQQDHDVRQQIAESQARIQEREIARDRQAQTVDATVRMVRGRVELAQQIAELETQAPPGGAGHAEAVAKLTGDWRDTFLSTLPDDEEIRQKFSLSLEDEAADLTVRAQQFERTQRIKKQGQDIEEALDLAGNVAAGDPTPQTADTQFSSLSLAIDAMDVDGNRKEALKTLAKQRVFGGLLSGMIESGKHGEASALLDKGLFNGVLSPEQIKAAQSRIGVETRRDEAQQAAALREREAQAKENVGLITDRLKEGHFVDDAALVAAANQAKEFNLGREWFDLDVARVEASTNRRYGDATATQLRGVIAGLDARIKAAGNKAKGEDITMLRRLKEIQDKKRGKEAEPYRDLWAQGVTGQLSVAQQLQALPMEERVAVAAKVDPNGSLASAVQLPPLTARMALNGRADRAANPDMLPPKGDVQKAFVALMGSAASEVDGKGLAAIRDIATDIYARMAREGGFKDFDRDAFGQAVSLALGREGNGGGLGGYKGKPVLLPRGVTSAGLEAGIARNSFADAAGAAAVVRDRFTPRWIGEDEQGTAQYVFIDERGRWLMRKSDPKRPYVMDLRR